METILSLCMKLLELENEQNVLVCLRIIIELHKHFRPAYNPEVCMVKSNQNTGTAVMSNSAYLF